MNMNCNYLTEILNNNFHIQLRIQSSNVLIIIADEEKKKGRERSNSVQQILFINLWCFFFLRWQSDKSIAKRSS